MKLFAGILLLFSVSLNAQDCSCSDALNDLIVKTETNYAGFHLMNRMEDSVSYRHHVDALRRRASEKIAECFYILRDYTAFFKDGHLGILELPKLSKSQSDSLARLAAFKETTETSIRQYVTKNLKRLDPVEGIWQNAQYRIAIIRSKVEKDIFEAVIIGSNNENWKPGQIKMLLHKTGDNLYETESFRGDHFKQHVQSQVFKNILLAAGNSQYVRTFPIDAGLKFINQSDPSLPTIHRIDDNNLLISIPSFAIDGRYLDSLLKANDDKITSTKNLIIDIRGNQGGNFIYGSLLSYISDKDSLISGEAKILSSADNISYHDNYIAYYKQQNLPVPDHLTSLLDRMKSNPGKVVPYYPFFKIGFEKIQLNPSNVAILTDNANLSAAEAFLKYAKQSGKVIQIGSNTRGVLDYMNVYTIPLSCNPRFYYLYYPVYFDAGLPESSINNKGIRPDIYSGAKGAALVNEAVKILKQR